MLIPLTRWLQIRLWYARPLAPLCLEHLVTVWTTHISNGEHGTLAPRSAPLFASIFPERDRGCHFMVHEQSDQGTLCKAPLEYKPRRALNGLMTLHNFVNGGYDILDCKILLVVKWIAAKKEVVTKKGEAKVLVNVGLSDDTAEATLTLWGSICTSASLWRVSQTVLLMSNPGWRIEQNVRLSVTTSTMIDVDPDMEDANWLRGWAQRLKRREHVNPEFPEDVFDFESLKSSQLKIKYTLAELDEFARGAPCKRFMGFMSIVLTELNLSLLQRRNMLMCNECCGVPIYDNVTSTKCKQCNASVDLRVNPGVLGALVDETGTTTCGSIVMSERAWEQLFGRSKRDLIRLNVDALKRIEQRLMFLRLILIFGWTAEQENEKAGRLCVWEIYS